MRRWRNVLVVSFLLVLLILTVYTGWMESLGSDEGNGRNPDTKESTTERFDHWIPKMP